MTTFDDRENAFESKFAHDAEMQFRAEARRNKLVGLWAAELLGKSGDDAAAYAVEVVSADFEEAGIEDVVRTRIYLRDAAKWEPVSRAHGRVFGAIMPANTLLVAGGLIGDYEVEIEAEALVEAKS